MSKYPKLWNFHDNIDDLKLVEYIDSDWESNKETRKSTSWYVFHLN